MDMRQRILNFAAKLRKQFPEGDGQHAVVVNHAQHTSLYDGFQGDPTEDTRPNFVKADEAGWQVIARYNDK